jgi:hypothetical protein
VTVAALTLRPKKLLSAALPPCGNQRRAHCSIYTVTCALRSFRRPTASLYTHWQI